MSAFGFEHFRSIEEPLPPIDTGPPTHEILRNGRKLAVHTANFVQVWLAFEEDGLDLRPYECHDEIIGKLEYPNGWYAYELGESGYENWFSPKDSWPKDEGPGVFLHKWSRWAMEHGIAPGQAFCVRLRRPHVYELSDGETDADFDEPEILEVERMTPLEVQRAWEHHLMESWREQDELDWQHRVVLERRATDSNALYVSIVRDNPDGRPSAGGKSSYRAQLYSRHGHFHDETRGQAKLADEVDTKSTLRALARMLKTVRTKYPALSLRKIVALGMRALLNSNWRDVHWRLCRAHCGDRFKTHAQNPMPQFCDGCHELIDKGRRLVGDALDLLEGEPARVFLKFFRDNRVEFESAWRLGANDDTLHRILFAPLSRKGLHWKLLQAMEHERDSLVELRKQGVF